MNPKYVVIAGLCVSSSLAACSKQATENHAAPTASAAKLSDDALEQASIPVKEDFEELANQQISDENLDEQVRLLEKQIEADQ